MIITNLNSIVQSSVDSSYSDAQVKTKYENNLDTNVFTDADKNKLDAIEPNATTDQTKADIDSLGINAATVNGKSVNTAVPSGAVFTDTETTTRISFAGNVLTYTDELGADTNIDLSLYLDDTNLARLVSGTLEASTGIATFTRDDGTTFTLDLSSLLDTQVTVNDSLTSTSTTEALSANQGKSLQDNKVDKVNGKELSANDFTDDLKTKLNTIESGATADQTASEILTAIKMVDGSGSGLDADLLDGQQGSYYKISSNISVASSGNLNSNTVQSALEELQGDIDVINTIIGVD